MAAPVALVTAVPTYVHVAAETIQLHGGIGFTWEHDAHLYFKRAKSTELLLGGTPGLRTEVAERADLFGAE